MQFTIESRKLGKTVTFSTSVTGYIFVDIDGESGTLGKQICKGGRLMGSTLQYTGNCQKEFEKICRNWWKQYISA